MAGTTPVLLLEPDQRTVCRVPPLCFPATAQTDSQLELRREIGIVLRRVATFGFVRVALIAIAACCLVRHRYRDSRLRG